MKKIIWEIGVQRRTVVSSVYTSVSVSSESSGSVSQLKIQNPNPNPGERFDWSVDRVAVGKCVM